MDVVVRRVCPVHVENWSYDQYMTFFHEVNCLRYVCMCVCLYVCIHNLYNWDEHKLVPHLQVCEKFY